MIDRTVALMRLVATYRPKGARLTDLAEEAFLPAPTVRRILKRLVEHGLILQDCSERRYRLGHLAYELGLSASHLTNDARDYRPLLDELVRATGHTMYLLMRSGLDSVCIDRADAATSDCKLTRCVGDRLPLGVGVGGMALLAALPENDAEAIIEVNQSVYRRFVRTTGSTFREHLETARKNGFIVRRSPVTPGVLGIGMVLPSCEGPPRLAVAGATKARWFSERDRIEAVATMREIIARHAPSTNCDVGPIDIAAFAMGSADADQPQAMVQS
jgi:DNA-binding IclR family transcriptional regulator